MNEVIVFEARIGDVQEIINEKINEDYRLTHMFYMDGKSFCVVMSKNVALEALSSEILSFDNPKIDELEKLVYQLKEDNVKLHNRLNELSKKKSTNIAKAA